VTTDPLSEPWRDVRQLMASNAADTVPPVTTGDRARSVGHWLRDTGLGITGFILVLIVALAGWTASFIGLHDFGMRHMGLSADAAWLVPITFDGAPLGLSLVVFRASIHGRGASVWRWFIVVFTGLSSWINWQHIEDPTGRWIASFMPPAAVILFEGLMSEARAAASRRLGRERPRLHPLRWLIDRSGTWQIYRAYVLNISLPEHLQQSTEADRPKPETVDGTATETAAVQPTETSAPVDRSMPETVDGTGDQTTDGNTAKPSTPRRPKAARTVAGRKAPRRSLDEWVELAGPVFHAEFRRLRRNPTAAEFAEAIKTARLGAVSDTRAKSIRTEILDRAELPNLDGSE
jgi:hypothetical protein